MLKERYAKMYAQPLIWYPIFIKTHLLPKASILCKKLSDYSIKQTIVQPDFNDNNTLIDNVSNITTIDLGEIVISHPFFSLLK